MTITFNCRDSVSFNMSFYMVTDRPTKIANYSDLYNFYFKPRRRNKVIFHLWSPSKIQF